jgi:hypothetical protein
MAMQEVRSKVKMGPPVKPEDDRECKPEDDTMGIYLPLFT